MELKKIKDKNIITVVEEGSIAEELDIRPGDVLVSVNSEKIEDIIEYKYLTADDYVELEIINSDNETVIYEIEKEIDEDIGIDFENPIIDSVKTCRNNCVFCFVDQLPKNMRETLYIKDDDSRLSFLQGNFITMTNMFDKEIDKMIKYKISPVNISVHTTNSDLRIKMLGNRFAGDILEKMKKLRDADIAMNAQVVLVRGLNDEEELDKTINDLSELYPQLSSMAIVPLGVTKHREGLEKLQLFDKESSIRVIDQVHRIQKKLFDRSGTRFVFLSDEFYIMAERDIPPYEHYEQFIQLENGVGLIAKLKAEFEDYLGQVDTSDIFHPEAGRIPHRKISIATGVSAYGFIKQLSSQLMDRFSNLDINVYKIDNDFFGNTITVSGLITASDIIAQLKNEDLGESLILPRSMMKQDEDIFLDDLTPDDLQRSLSVPVIIADTDGKSFIEAVLKGNGHDLLVENQH